MKKVISLLLCLFISQAALAADIAIFLGTLSITGTIEKGDAVALEKKLEEDFRRLTIRSTGGNVLEAIAMAMAKLLRTSRKHLVVHQYCLSACALLFALVDKRSIERGLLSSGWLAFHAGDWGWAATVIPAYLAYEPKSDAIREQFFKDRDQMLSRFQANMDAPAKAFDALNRDSAWLATVNELTGFKIRSIAFDEEQKRVSAQFHPATCDWWVPDNGALAEIGIVLRDFVIPERAKIAERLQVSQDRIYWGKLSDLASLTASPCAAATKNTSIDLNKRNAGQTH